MKVKSKPKSRHRKILRECVMGNTGMSLFVLIIGMFVGALTLYWSKTIMISFLQQYSVMMRKADAANEVDSLTKQINHIIRLRYLPDAALGELPSIEYRESYVFPLTTSANCGNQVLTPPCKDLIIRQRDTETGLQFQLVQIINVCSPVANTSTSVATVPFHVSFCCPANHLPRVYVKTFRFLPTGVLTLVKETAIPESAPGAFACFRGDTTSLSIETGWIYSGQKDQLLSYTKNETLSLIRTSMVEMLPR